MKNLLNLKFIPALFIVLILVVSCKPKTSMDETGTTGDTTALKGDSLANAWIDESEMEKLSNTWVDAADTAEVSSTWTEDAYADKLSGSGSLANSWVDESGESIYKQGDVPPEFVGGQQALFAYLKGNIKYPADVERGTVYVAFVIGSDGSIMDVRVYKGVKESMDKEAIRLITEMPKWDPGMVNGKAASIVHGLPIIFRP